MVLQLSNVFRRAKAYLIAVALPIALIALSLSPLRCNPEPNVYYRGVGLEYGPTAQDPWPGERTAIDVMWDWLWNADGPDKAHAMMHIYIRAMGRHDRITSVFLNGTIPQDQLAGTVDLQLNAAGTGTIITIVARDADADGNLITAGHSAIFHEMCEHIRPHELVGDWNSGHAPQWHSCTVEMTSLYDERVPGAGTSTSAP